MTTDALERQSAGPAPSSTPLFLRLAFRELRNGFGSFVIFIACIALGVAAIAGVGSLAGGLKESLRTQGQIILGGDMSVGLVHRRASPEERRFLEEHGRISEIATFRTMARAADGEKVALVQLKAVDAAYPLFGAVKARDGGERAVGTEPLQSTGTALVEELLLSRLGLGVGDMLRIGDARVRIEGLLDAEPDQLSGRPAFGPRVLISLPTLETTGLIQPGSLMRWFYRLRLAPETGTGESALKDIEIALKAKFPNGGYAFRTRADPNPNLRRGIERFAQFLTLIGIATLAIGGIGVANAIATYLARKREVIAAFKCLGASARTILWTYLTQILVLAGIGIAIGLTVGAAIPALAAWAYRDALPLDIALVPAPGALALAALYGLLTALLFALWPLGQARDVSPTLLLRQPVTGEARRPRWSFVVAALVAGACLIAIAVLSSELVLLALYACIGLVVVLGLYLGLGWVLQRLARRLPRPKRAEWALARANIANPTGLARHVTLSLGASLALLATVAAVHHSLTIEFETGLPEQSPNYFILDIGKEQIGPLETLIRDAAPGAVFDRAPMLRGRIMALKGVESAKIKAPPDVAWVLNGDRGITFAETLPESSKLIAGEWWPQDYSGPPLVSFAADIARGFGLEVGDMVSVNVLGRAISARIANLRAVDWESLGINFVMVFSPNALAGAPYRLLATVTLPDSFATAEEGRLVQRLTERFPNVTAIRVRDAINAFKAIAEQMLTGIRLASGLTLIVGAIVLAGALATAHRRRMAEAQIFKMLGATRRRIVAAHLAEYAVLGLVTGVAAAAVATLGAWLILTLVMDADFSFSALALLETMGLAMLLVMGLGAIGTWRVLGRGAARGLRSE